MFSQKYPSVTPDHFTAVAALIQKETGIAIQGNQGQAGADGLEMQWDYEPSTEILTVTCVKKPFFVSDGMIQSKVDDIMNQSFPPIPKI